MRRQKYIYGLEIGTAKICVVAGEVAPPDQIRLINVVSGRSNGIRKGMVVDQHAVVNELREILARVEEQLDDEIDELYLVVGVPNVVGRDNRVVKHLSNGCRTVEREDVLDLMEEARVVPVDPTKVILWSELHKFKLDDREGITDPVGMVGSKLEVVTHIVEANANHVAAFTKAIGTLSLDVADVVFSGGCAGLAVLTPEARELGSIVIDMGAGVTSYAAYYKGALVASGTIAVGGDHVTNDIAHAFDVSFVVAEGIKLSYGSALYRPGKTHEEFCVDLGAVRGKRRFSIGALHMVMQCRLEETLRIVYEQISSICPINLFRRGIFLCGGCAGTPYIVELAKSVFRLPCQIGVCNSVNGISSQLSRPEYASPIGLFMHAANRELQQYKKRPRAVREVKDFLGQFAAAFRHALFNVI